MNVMADVATRKNCVDAREMGCQVRAQQSRRIARGGGLREIDKIRSKLDGWGRGTGFKGQPRFSRGRGGIVDIESAI